MLKAFMTGLVLVAGQAGAMDIPLSDLSGWTSLSYRKIPANEVSASDGSLHIAVNQSASPLIYRLPAPVNLAGITVRARWNGELNVPPGAVQGNKGADDFVLKLGVVEAGDQTLNWLQRRIAADWILELFRLAPEDGGVKRIEFLSTTQQENLVGSSRVHPLSDLLHEIRVVHLAEAGAFELTYTFEQPVEALALWVSSDGDDTGSRFDLYLDRISLTAD